MAFSLLSRLIPGLIILLGAGEVTVILSTSRRCFKPEPTGTNHRPEPERHQLHGHPWSHPQGASERDLPRLVDRRAFFHTVKLHLMKPSGRTACLRVLQSFRFSPRSRSHLWKGYGVLVGSDSAERQGSICANASRGISFEARRHHDPSQGTVPRKYPSGVSIHCSGLALSGSTIGRMSLEG